MAKEAEKILNGRITEGLVVTKYEHGGKLRHLKVIEAGHPIQENSILEITLTSEHMH